MGMVRRAQEGEWNGGPAPFAYDAVDAGQHNGHKAKRRLVPNAHAPIVRELYERYAAGQGMRRLTLWLNREKGIRSPRGGTFTDASVSGILKNPVYAGYAAWDWGVKNGARRPEAIVVEGKHEAIVPRDLWELVQRVRESRGALPPRHATGVHLLTGIGRCGLCGAHLKMNVDRRRREQRFYRCGNYVTKGTCSVSGIPAGPLEENFVTAIRAAAYELADQERLSQYVSAHLQEAMRSREWSTPDALRRHMSQAKQAIAVWDAALEQGKISLSVWQHKTAPHCARVRDLERELLDAQLEPGLDTTAGELVRAALSSFETIWSGATREERKALAISFFREVRVYPNRRVEVLPRLISSEPVHISTAGD